MLFAEYGRPKAGENLHMHEYRYVFLVLIAYAWAMMPVIFLLSFTFKEATSAYVWVTIANILSGMSYYF